MIETKTNPKADWYFVKENEWREGFKKLRVIILELGLTEHLKWGHPCYSIGDSNIVLMHGFKNYFALLFMKGSLMADPEKILVQQTENVQSARQIRFASVSQIVEMEETIKAYVLKAILVEKSGAKVDFTEKNTELVYPEEFQNKLDEIPALREAFEALTPGRRRGYHLYFTAAKRPRTRAVRVQKNLDRIIGGLGLDD